MLICGCSSALRKRSGYSQQSSTASPSYPRNCTPTSDVFLWCRDALERSLPESQLNSRSITTQGPAWRYSRGLGGQVTNGCIKSAANNIRSLAPVLSATNMALIKTMACTLRLFKFQPAVLGSTIIVVKPIMFSKLARPLQLLQPGAAPANGPAAALAAVSSSSAALEKPRVGPGSCKAAAALQRQQCAYICAQNHCRCWRDAATWSRRRSGAAANVGQRTCCWAKQPSTLASWRCAQIQSAPRRRGPARWRAQPAVRSEAAGRSDGAAR